MFRHQFSNYDDFDNKDLIINDITHVCNSKCCYNIVFAFSNTITIHSALNSCCIFIKAFAQMAYLRRYRINKIEKLYDPYDIYSNLFSNPNLIILGNFKFLTGLLDTIMDYDTHSAPIAAIAAVWLKLDIMLETFSDKSLTNYSKSEYRDYFVENRNNAILVNPYNADNVVNSLSRAYLIISTHDVIKNIFLRAMLSHKTNIDIIVKVFSMYNHSYHNSGFIQLLKDLECMN